MCIWPCATYGKIRWKLYATYRTRLLRIYSTVQPKASSNGNVIINILYVRLVMLMRFRSFKIVVSNWFVLFFFFAFSSRQNHFNVLLRIDLCENITFCRAKNKMGFLSFENNYMPSMLRPELVNLSLFSWENAKQPPKSLIQPFFFFFCKFVWPFVGRMVHILLVEWLWSI